MVQIFGNMKFYIVLMVFFCAALGMKAQNMTSYVQHELSKLEQKLTKDGEHLKLNNEQTIQLTKLLEDKGTRIEFYKNKYPQKDVMSAALIKLDAEYNPRLSAILNTQQRIVLQKGSSSK